MGQGLLSRETGRANYQFHRQARDSTACLLDLPGSPPLPRAQRGAGSLVGALRGGWLAGEWLPVPSLPTSVGCPQPLRAAAAVAATGLASPSDQGHPPPLRRTRWGPPAATVWLCRRAPQAGDRLQLRVWAPVQHGVGFRDSGLLTRVRPGQHCRAAPAASCRHILPAIPLGTPPSPFPPRRPPRRLPS